MVLALCPAPSKPNLNPIRADSSATLHFFTQMYEINRLSKAEANDSRRGQRHWD
jgi:hypothetical protein